MRLLMIIILSLLLTAELNLAENIANNSQQSDGFGPQPASENPRPQANNTANDIGLSRNWAGYEVSGTDITGVSATWNVPSLVRSDVPGYDATWIGIGGVNSSDLIQAGTQTGIDANGQTFYRVFYETLPDASQLLPMQISAGDSMTVKLNRIRGSHWNISIRDNTTGQTSTENLTYNSSLSSAEWIEEDPSGMRRFLPLDNFGSVRFTAAALVKSGKTLTPAEAGAQPITMHNVVGQTLANTSSINSHGSGFSVTRTSAPSVPANVPGYEYGGYPGRGHIIIILG